MPRNIISYYELAEDFRRSVEQRFSAPIGFTVINRLRELGLTGMLRKLRALKLRDVTIAIENENSRQLVGPLIVMAAMTGSERVDVLWPDGTLERISCRAVAVWSFKILMAQISSRVAYWRAGQRLRALESDGPLSMPLRRKGRNVLYLDGNLPIGAATGGSITHIRGVIDGLAGKGFHVDYASGRAIPTEQAGSRWLKIPSVDFLALPPEFNCYRFNGTFDGYAEDYAQGSSYSFIYQRMSVHNFTGAMLRRNLGIPLVLEYNGSEAWVAASWSRKLRLHEMAVRTELASLRNADLVVTVSDALAEEVAAAGIPLEKIVTYPNCIDPLIFDPSRFSPEKICDLRCRLQIRPDALVATFIGTFGAWHGVDFLAKAVRRLIDNNGNWVVEHKLHFLLIGDGLKMSEVRALLCQKPYSGFVTLTGMVPQNSAPAYLAASDIFLSPHLPNADGSEFFGSPTKLFEYMAMERPIVASDLAQIGSVLRGEYPGFAEAPVAPMAELFIPGDENDFLAALRKVVENPKSAREMARNARAAALNSFTWNHHVSAILSRARDLGVLE